QCQSRCRAAGRGRSPPPSGAGPPAGARSAPSHGGSRPGSDRRSGARDPAATLPSACAGCRSRRDFTTLSGVSLNMRKRVAALTTAVAFVLIVVGPFVPPPPQEAATPGAVVLNTRMVLSDPAAHLSHPVEASQSLDDVR